VGERQYNVTNAGDGDLTFQQDYHANSLTDNSTDVGESMHTTSTTETTTTSAGDTFGDQAYNSGRLNSNDDATHTPTVVDQPTPVVIQQPAPIVVSP
jgi:hypothetical protein